MERSSAARRAAVALAAVASIAGALAAELEPIPGDDPKFPRLRDADGRVSLNDRCPVRAKPLNPKMAPIYVNGSPVGFC